jgi:hypothetical protein
MSPRSARFALVLAIFALAACSKAASELEPPPPAASAAPAVAPLVWDVPGVWTVMETPGRGTRKAVYKVPKAGNDKEDAELTVFFFGTGNKGDPAPNFKEWFGQFDGDVGATAARDSFDARDLKVETVEVGGTYKVPMGPQLGPKKKAPMQMVKQNFRLYGAVVKTPDRGNWFFKLTGPDETVQAARPALRALLESAR